MHDDYYSQGQEVRGQWLGEGAKRLGLEGDVEKQDFVALIQNRNPKTGKKLTARDKKDRRPGYDATLSAWKSASVMAEVYGCWDIREMFVEAGDDMMTQKAEPEMRARVGIGGQDHDRITGEMICAGYLHANTRPVRGKSDPHVHKHYYILNATWDDHPTEKRWKAAQLGELKASQKYLKF